MLILPNSALLANSAKNRKKAEKKRRCQERRNSESDSSSLDTARLSESQEDSDTARLSESQEDSGFASSLEESIAMEDLGSEVEEAAAKMISEATGLEAPWEVIFDMDF